MTAQPGQKEERKVTTRGIILRIVCFIPIAIILLINFLIGWMIAVIRFAKYGGEFITYSNVDKKTIESLYRLLKEQNQDKL